MALVDLKAPLDRTAIPGDVRSFLREAERRIGRFNQASSVPSFVPSDFEGAYGMVRALAAADLTTGRIFCEWGSGFGVVACLAAMLDFDACGVEVEGELVDAARKLAEDFSLPVEFVQGSFIPTGADIYLKDSGGYSWLATEDGSAYEELGLDPDELNIVFAYPWPDEECLIAQLFERYAGAGAELLTYHGGEEFRRRRKTAKRRRRTASR